MDSPKLCLLVVYITICFFTHALSLSFYRMASDHVKVWVKVEDGNPTGVCIENSANIDDLIAAALEQEEVDIAPDLVTVEFEGVKICEDRLVTEFDTSDENPLLLKCPDDCEGMWLEYVIILGDSQNVKHEVSVSEQIMTNASPHAFTCHVSHS